MGDNMGMRGAYKSFKKIESAVRTLLGYDFRSFCNGGVVAIFSSIGFVRAAF
jgi:hypothetical protein